MAAFSERLVLKQVSSSYEHIPFSECLFFYSLVYYCEGNWTFAYEVSYQSQICTKLTTGHITVVGLLPFCSHIVHMSYILRLSTSMELQNFYFVLRVIRNLCTYPRNGIVIKFAFLPV